MLFVHYCLLGSAKHTYLQQLESRSPNIKRPKGFAFFWAGAALDICAKYFRRGGTLRCIHTLNSALLLHTHPPACYISYPRCQFNFYPCLAISIYMYNNSSIASIYLTAGSGFQSAPTPSRGISLLFSQSKPGRF